MKKIKLLQFDPEVDLPQIFAWTDELEKARADGDPKFDSIYKYILENGLIRNFKELFATNYEQFEIGKDERKNIILAKTDEDKVVGFMIIQIYKLTEKEPEMFLQYIVIHPDFQGKKIGEQMLENLGGLLEKLYGKKPVELYAYVHKENTASLNLFKKFDLDFFDEGKTYKKVFGAFPNSQKTKE